MLAAHSANLPKFGHWLQFPSLQRAMEYAYGWAATGKETGFICNDRPKTQQFFRTPPGFLRVDDNQWVVLEGRDLERVKEANLPDLCLIRRTNLDVDA